MTVSPRLLRFGANARHFVRRRPHVVAAGLFIVLIAAIAVFAPWLGTQDPQAINPRQRLQPPSPDAWFGTDQLGRDIYSRTLYGARISLVVGFGVAAASLLAGILLGLAAGYSRIWDAILMRIMDGMMAIPSILLAVALMAISSASIQNVIFAITVAEIPRVTRLMRSMVLSLRSRLYVEAAVTAGTPPVRLVFRHILPNATAPLAVQGTFICASAILTEAVLSFIGAGTPADIASWGNMIAEGRTLFQIAIHLMAFPALVLSLTILAVNVLGDGLRDALDPSMARAL